MKTIVGYIAVFLAALFGLAALGYLSAAVTSRSLVALAYMAVSGILAVAFLVMSRRLFGGVITSGDYSNIAREAAVLAGLAIVLSKLFPIASWLHNFTSLSNGFMWLSISRSTAPLAMAAIPAFVLLNHGRIWQRLPRSGLWLPMLGLWSIAYLIAYIPHWNWNPVFERFGFTMTDFYMGMNGSYVEDAIRIILTGGVLVALVGVLVNLRPPKESFRVDAEVA